MARRPKKKYQRRFPSRGKYLRGTIDEELDLGTLASRTLVSVLMDESVTETTWLSSIRSTYSVSGWTPATDVGPLMVGVAHSDYTDAEIEQVIESTQSWNIADKIAQEVSGRLVRRIGVFEVPSGPNAVVVLNDGKPIRTKLNWKLSTGQTLRLWAYNMGQAPFATTTPQVFAEGQANLWPQ